MSLDAYVAALSQVPDLEIDHDFGPADDECVQCLNTVARGQYGQPDRLCVSCGEEKTATTHRRRQF